MIEIVRDFSEELMDAGKLAHERLVIRAMAAEIITKQGGRALLQAIWGA